jgi:hypothetical protein
MRRSPKPYARALRTTLIVASVAMPLSARAQTPPPPAAAPLPQTAPVMPKEVALTDKQIQGVLDAQKDYDAIAEKMPKTEAAQTDPQYVAQFEATAKKYGFASYADYNDVVLTISLVLNGFDGRTKTYVGPEAVLKQQLAAAQADPKIPANDKKALIDELNAVLKSPPPPVQNKANIDLVAKFYDKLAAAMSEEN